MEEASNGFLRQKHGSSVIPEMFFGALAPILVSFETAAPDPCIAANSLSSTRENKNKDFLLSPNSPESKTGHTKSLHP